MISDVRAHMRTRLIGLGFTEWTDGFNFENIPRTKLNSVFCLELGSVRSGSTGMDNQWIEVPVTVRLFREADRKPVQGIDKGVEVADRVIQDVLRIVNQPVGTYLKGVDFTAMGIDPIAHSNDNGVIIKLDFTAQVLLATR